MSGLCRLIYPQWQGAHFPANSFYKDQFFGSPQSLVDRLQGWSRQTPSHGVPCLIAGRCCFLVSTKL